MENSRVIAGVILALLLLGCRTPVGKTPTSETSPIIDSPVDMPVATQTTKSTAPPLLTPTLASTPIPVPVAIHETIHSTPNCKQENEMIKCQDNLLDIEFEYPVHWGEIAASLHKGLSSGYGYDYAFTDSQTGQPASVVAGGRSHDYADNRGGRVGDFFGFGSKSSEQVCRETPADVCEVIKPGVVLLIFFPDAKLVCDFFPAMHTYPLGAVSINLPEPGLINGFEFASRILPRDLEQELYAIVGAEDGQNAVHCNEQARQEFDTRAAALVEQIKSGSVDDETASNIQALYHLANTVEGAGIGE